MTFKMLILYLTIVTSTNNWKMHNTMAYNPMNQDKYKMIPKSHLISNIFNLAIFWNFLKLFPRSDAGVDK